MDSRSPVEEHYHRPGLFEAILQRLQTEGVTRENIRREDIAGADEFHVRGAEVSKELASQIGIQGKKVLDVGCGIGGPARMLAADFDCHVTGIDLSEEFVRTATELSELLGLGDKTKFQRADALRLPFDDESYDVVWTQHVQMNVEDKKGFYREISRVLKPSGTFLYYDIFSKDGRDVAYPVPWADGASVSFLQSVDNLAEILEHLGLEKMQTQDQTAAGVDFFESVFARIRDSGPPRVGLNVLMGESATEKLGNVLNGLKEGRIELQSGVYVKGTS